MLWLVQMNNLIATEESTHQICMGKKRSKRLKPTILYVPELSCLCTCLALRQALHEDQLMMVCVDNSSDQPTQ